MGYSYYDLEAMTGPLFPIVTMEEKIMKTIAKGALGALWTASALLACGGVTFAAQMAKFSYPVAKDSTMGRTVEHFSSLVEDKTGGDITVRNFSDAQLGNEIQSAQSAQGGTIEFTVTTTAALASNVPDFNLFNLPFTFSSYEQLDKVSRGPTSKKVLAKLQDSQLVGLCYWDYGFRNLTNNKHPVKNMADAAGLRVRTIQNGVYIDSMKAMGMNPQPLPFPETFTALETGALDAVEIANDVTRAASFYEVQKYLTETKHLTTLSVVLVSKQFWDSLSAENQEKIQAACDETSDFNRNIIVESGAETLQFLKDQGMEVSEISPEALAEFKTAVEPVVTQVHATIDPELTAAFTAEVEAAASN